MRSTFLASIVATTFLSACGGGGSSTPPPTPGPVPAPPPAENPTDLPSSGVKFYFSEQNKRHEAAGIVALHPQGTVVTSSHWEQTSGPALNPLAYDSKVIGFDVPTAGDYSFTYTATLQDGSQVSESVSFSATATTAQVAVRLDHAAVEGGRVSLRVDKTPAAQNKTIASVNWEQTLGDAVSPSRITVQDNQYFVNAPRVSKDRLLGFTATVTFTDGSTASDEALVLVKEKSISNGGYFTGNDNFVSDDVKPYRADSPYANGLRDCVYNNLISRSCAFSKLPLIGMVHDDPSLDDILDHLMVSHPWMAQRFIEFMQTSATAGDLLKLLRGVTAIVISYDVRPSFYWAATGAIYLDAAYFWVTPQERDTLNTAPDYRSAFGNDLKFIMPWRYTKNSQYYPVKSYPYASRLTREFADLEASITRLLYHELGHANDFFPPTSWANIETSDSPLAYVNANGVVSEEFINAYPLSSQQMKDLARVSFGGEDASEEQKNYQPADISSFFAPDKANDYYGYYTPREDYAMLFERFMMAHRLGAYADVAVTPTCTQADCTYTVDWGQRGRFMADHIRPRLRYVVENVMPELDFNAAVDGLNEPVPMESGVPWHDNLISSGMGASGERHLPANSEFQFGDRHRGRPTLPAN